MLGNNIGSRTKKLVINSTPISAGSWFAKYYQKNQKDETDPKGKLVIQNYTKDLNMMVFWGWDVIAADETDDNYLFQLEFRGNPKLRVYITLGRNLQYAELPYYPEMMYQCYIHDDEGKWDNRSWFRAHDLTYKNFWNVIEEIVNKNEPDPLPF